MGKQISVDVYVGYAEVDVDLAAVIESATPEDLRECGAFEKEPRPPEIWDDIRLAIRRHDLVKTLRFLEQLGAHDGVILDTSPLLRRAAA